VSDPRGHDHEPDQAALDELMRAFADDVADEVVIVEHEPEAAEPPDADASTEPVDDRDETEAGHTPPPIIRIDDYAGSSRIVPAETQPIAAPNDPDDSSDDGPDGSSDDGSTEARPAPVVIAIDDEDLPDPVYVEGSLDRSGSRSIVFIEDDDTGDTMQPESERDIRRGIEPRMRERRVAVKRAQGRKRLKWVALVVAILFVVVGALALLGSSLFAIKADQISVTGDVYTDPERLQAVIDDLVGTPALLADTQAAERELESIPWVADARVRTDFPHRASIEIREREAIATYQGPDQRFRVLDREGRVLDVLDGYPLAYLLLGGPDPVDLEPGEFAPRGYAAASELAKNLTGSVRLPGRVEIIEVTADGSRLIMRLNDGTEVRFGEARELFAKLVRLETVLSSGESLESSVIDISTSEVTR
jgi:cell division protein FtsQ